MRARDPNPEGALRQGWRSEDPTTYLLARRAAEFDALGENGSGSGWVVVDESERQGIKR